MSIERSFTKNLAIFDRLLAQKIGLIASIIYIELQNIEYEKDEGWFTDIVKYLIDRNGLTKKEIEKGLKILVKENMIEIKKTKINRYFRIKEVKHD